MAAVVREVTCLVYSDNERNRIALLSGVPSWHCKKLEQTHRIRAYAQDEGSYGDGRSVMPLDALGRTRNTMLTQARTFVRKDLQIARKVSSVGIEDCNYFS